MARALLQVGDGNRQEGQHRHGRPELGQAQGCGVFGEVRHPQRFGQAAQVLEDARPAGYLLQSLELVGGQARGQQGLQLTSVAQHGQDAVAGACEGAGAVHRLLEHGVKVQVAGDAQAGPTEPGEALPQAVDHVLHFALRIFGMVHVVDPGGPDGRVVGSVVTGGVPVSR